MYSIRGILQSLASILPTTKIVAQPLLQSFSFTSSIQIKFLHVCLSKGCLILFPTNSSDHNINQLKETSTHGGFFFADHFRVASTVADKGSAPQLPFGLEMG